MNRREFIKLCQTLGLALPLQPVLSAYGANKTTAGGSKRSVIIIGAGAAGLAAGYLLHQQGIDFQILEASSNVGGRMKRTTTFADFPIPLGAEWIHVDPTILDEIVNDDRVNVDIHTTLYDPVVDYGLYEGERITIYDADFSADSKFINATWFDFFAQYIQPAIDAHITYDAVVEAIDYSADTVQVKTQHQTYTADQVIVTVPVKLLQKGLIDFIPPLPRRKQNAIDSVSVWSGCKAFIEFSEKFYPALIGFEVTPASAGQKLYYDAAYGQNTSQHILGLFAVGSAADTYVSLADDDLIQHMLAELDVLFDGQASASYVKHIFQNWNAEPYAQGAYVIDDEDWRTVRALGQSVDQRVFFAGDAYTEGEDWSSVHTAVRSARRAVEEILIKS